LIPFIFNILFFYFLDNPFVNGKNPNQIINLGNLNKQNAFVCNSENKYDSLYNKKEKIVYIFNILKSRKKEKKYLRKRYNKIISRVHNMDCLLKKIKA
jgi:c-di-AMP phosphodiesterase-like protein